MSRFIKIGKNNYNKDNIDFYSYECEEHKIYKGELNGKSIYDRYFVIIFRLNIKGVEHIEAIDWNSFTECNQVVNYIELELNK